MLLLLVIDLRPTQHYYELSSMTIIDIRLERACYPCDAKKVLEPIQIFGPIVIQSSSNEGTILCSRRLQSLLMHISRIVRYFFLFLSMFSRDLQSL